MTIAKYCPCSVIFKAGTGGTYLPIVYIHCKIANILYSQLLCLVIRSFFIFNGLYAVH